MEHNLLGGYICRHYLSHVTYPSDGSSNFYSGIHLDTSGRSPRDWRKVLLYSRDWTSYDHTLSMSSQSRAVVLGEILLCLRGRGYSSNVAACYQT